MHPSLRDLVTILYRPRETVRRILDGGKRWTWEVIVLASVCSSYFDPDINRIKAVTLTTKIAIAVLAVIVNAIVWIAVAYLFAWGATLVGRRLEGSGSVADVRTAIAWSLVPQVWSIVFRIPASLYMSRYAGHVSDPHRAVLAFVQQGGCSIVVVLITIQLFLYALIVFDASSTVGEALHFSTLRGFGTIAITAVIPIVVTVAAVIATRT